MKEKNDKSKQDTNQLPPQSFGLLSDTQVKTNDHDPSKERMLLAGRQ